MRAALQFLTVIPVPAPNVPPGSAALWYPLVGTLIGLMVAAAWHTPLQATLAIVTAVALTGGLHEDGLADVCDAVRAGRSRERIFEILKDSRIGSYGATAIVLSVLARWHAMSMLSGNVWAQLAFAFAASRASMVVLAAATPAAAPGLGESFRAALPRGSIIIIAAQVLALAALVPSFAGCKAAAAVAISIVLVRTWLMARLGGITGDCLGFQCQIAESSALMALAWH